MRKYTCTADGKIEEYCRATANADKPLADTCGLLYCIVDAEVVRVEIGLGFVVSPRPEGAAFGQAGSTRLDSTRLDSVRFVWLNSVFPAAEWIFTVVAGKCWFKLFGHVTNASCSSCCFAS